MSTYSFTHSGPASRGDHPFGYGMYSVPGTPYYSVHGPYGIPTMPYSNPLNRLSSAAYAYLFGAPHTGAYARMYAPRAQYGDSEAFRRWRALRGQAFAQPAVDADTARIRAETRKRAHEMRARAREEKKKKRHAQQRLAAAQAHYEETWQRLLAGTLDRELAFEDVPWPVFSLAPKRGAPSALGADAIAKFLLPRGAAAAKERRVRLREALLRFHPDKFEGRCLRYVREADQERVREGVAEVTRGINALLLQ